MYEEAKELLKKSNSTIERTIHDIKRAQAEKEQTKELQKKPKRFNARKPVESVHPQGTWQQMTGIQRAEKALPVIKDKAINTHESVDTKPDIPNPFKPGVDEVMGMLDYRTIGGTQFLGIKKPVIKAHGSSDALAFRNAVYQAQTAAECDFSGELEQSLRRLAAEKESENA